MGGGSLGFIVEILVALLLAVTIGYCLVVNRKLERLRSDQSELKEFIRELNMATTHAEHAISGLQKSADNAEEMLGSHIESARELATRLAHGIAQAEEVYSKLELLNQLQRHAPSSKSPEPQQRKRPSHGLRASKLGLGLLNAEEGGSAPANINQDAA